MRYIIILILISFFENSEVLANDTLKINSLLDSAYYYFEVNNYEKSAKQLLLALDVNPNLGVAHIMLARCYINSVEECSKNAMDRFMIYRLALDKFEIAKQVDSTYTKQADKFIEVYSKYVPTNEEIITEISEGEIYFIKCWINKSTIVRFRDMNTPAREGL